MKRLLIAVSLLAAAYAAQAAGPADHDPAVKAAGAWLAVVDSGKYADSWQQASPAFQKVETQAAWEQALQTVRTPLGKLLKRELADANYSTTLPGAPDGQYWVLHENTSFEHKAAAVETVVLTATDNGWKVVGYFIR